MTTEHQPDPISIRVRPDFTELERLFADLAFGLKAFREAFAQAPPWRPRTNSLSTAYHRRHVRNRRRR